MDVDTAPDDALVGLANAAVRYRIAVGPLTGQRTMRLRVPMPRESLPSTPGALTANHEGFSLNAAVGESATNSNAFAVPKNRHGDEEAAVERAAVH